jgi:type I restriction enzyme R subunit
MVRIPSRGMGFLITATYGRENGEVLAVVEAKRTAVDVRLAEAQLTYYVTEIEKHQSFRPFGFLANGYEIYFVDVGLPAKREVFGFFTRADLENLLSIRQNAKPLSSIEINNEIVERSYQHEAIRRVGEAFANGKRKSLILMATGTSNKRTVDYPPHSPTTLPAILLPPSKARMANQLIHVRTRKPF